MLPRLLAATAAAAFTLAGATTTATATPTGSARVDASTATSSAGDTSDDITVRFVSMGGSAAVGGGLYLNVAFSPEPETVTYQWYRDGSPIAEATKQWYVATLEDANTTLTATATASAAGYGPATATATSEPIAPADRYCDDPTFTTTTPGGTTGVGYPYTATPGACDSTGPGATVTYQWMRDDVPIPGATTASYTPVVADVGRRLGLRITYKLAGYRTVVQNTLGWTTPGHLSIKRAPQITGTRGVGKTLTLDVGEYTPAATGARVWWYVDGKEILGATTNQLAVPRAYAGKYLSAKVTVFATNAIPRTITTTRVGIPIHNTARPTVAGKAKRGSTLTAYRGSWTPLPSSYSYRWYRGSTAITGATARTYKLTSSDVGKRVKVKVTARRTGSSTGSAYSYSTSTIAR